jgi:pilus assembly protein CpaF
MASALDLLVHVARITGGRRKISAIAEVAGMEGDQMCLQDLFHYKQSGVGAEGHAQGQFEACGVRPRVLERMHEEGIALPQDLFHRRKLLSRPETP